jgi:hypothetical protein
VSKNRLISEILKRSVSPTWDLAKLEWQLIEIYETEDPDECLCGHNPIMEICVLQHRQNKTNVIVGNTCVNKFLGYPTDSIFQALKRVKVDVQKSFNRDAISFAFEKKWINEWENKFYLDIIDKRILTDKQIKKKRQINDRLMLKFKINPNVKTLKI